MAEYKNPNQPGGGGQDSRSLLVFTALFVAILVGLQYFKPKHPAAPRPSTTASSPAPASAPAAANAAATPQPAAAQNAAAAAPQITATQATTTTVENELYKITFTNRGAQVTSWILKKYTNYAGKPLDLVSPEAAQRFGYPLSVFTSDPNLRQQINQAMFVASASGTVQAPTQLSFQYSAGGLTVRKVFTFGNDYVIHGTVSATRDGAPIGAMLAWPAGFGDQRQAADYSKDQKIDRSSYSKAESLAPKKVENRQQMTGSIDWGGVSDLYFAAMFLPDNPSDATFVTLHHTLDVPADPDQPNSKLVPQPILGAAVGSAAATSSMRIFAGPKTLSVLKSIRGTGPNGKDTGPDLVPIVHYGMWSIIAKPLFYLLRWVYQHIVPNWGWAILVLTVVITLAMFPTRWTMMKSSIKMQRIQPQMNAIKEKYKKYKFDDPRKQEMNREMQDLYRKEGVNMFGGCLPMVIQFPLIFAFYAMLENAIELRHAHWFWLHDLSQPDPLHILPILMVGSQFFFQLFTPSPGVDAAQQKMMAFTMPLFSGFITWHYASGLALYWAGSNLIGIGQQMLINRTKLGREMRAIQARRAARKKGLKPAAAVRR